MRKYCATSIQVMQLPKYQKEWMATHLGHNLDIHKRFYRMPMESIETAKVAKALYLMQENKMHRARNLNLDTIDTILTQEDVFGGVSVEDYEDDCEGLEAGPTERQSTRNVSATVGSSNDNESGGVNAGDYADQLLNLDPDSIVPLSALPEVPTRGISSRKTTARNYRRWPKDQEQLVIREFASHFANRTTPNYKECMDKMHLFPHCNNVYTTLKEKVNNMNITNRSKEEAKKRAGNNGR